MLKAKEISQKTYGWLVIVLGFLGASASMVLAYEKLAVAEDPTHIPSCSLNPFLDCGKVLDAGADNLLFGLPNSFVGLVLFGALMAVGVSLLAGAKYKEWFWKLFYSGIVVGVLSVIFFFYQSLFVIGALCLYCMSIWIVVLALAWYSKIWLVERGTIKVPKRFEKLWLTLRHNHLTVLLLIYLFIYMAIAMKFDDLGWISYIWSS